MLFFLRYNCVILSPLQWCYSTLLLFYFLYSDVIFPAVHLCNSFSYTQMLFFLLYTDAIFLLFFLLYIDVLFLLYINIIFFDVIFSSYTLTLFFPPIHWYFFSPIHRWFFFTQISLHISVNSLIYWCYASYVPYVVIILPPIHLSRFELDEGF